MVFLGLQVVRTGLILFLYHLLGLAVVSHIDPFPPLPIQAVPTASIARLTKCVFVGYDANVTNRC